MNKADMHQEPVAWVEVKDTHHGPYEFHGKELLPVGKHDLYTSLPKRTWVGLNIEEIASCCMESTTTQLSFYNAIEAKLKEKNT